MNSVSVGANISTLWLAGSIPPAVPTLLVYIRSPMNSLLGFWGRTDDIVFIIYHIVIVSQKLRLIHPGEPCTRILKITVA